MDTTRIFHVAFVVDDLDEAMAQWGEALDLRFGRVQTPVIRWATPDGERDLLTKFVYSFNGPPYIELLERQDDSLWEQVGFHHLGVWSDDVAGESERLTSAGCAWSCAIVDPEHRRVGGCIHTVLDHARVELVSRASTMPRLARYISGGDWLAST